MVLHALSRLPKRARVAVGVVWNITVLLSRIAGAIIIGCAVLALFGWVEIEPARTVAAAVATWGWWTFIPDLFGVAGKVRAIIRGRRK
ncbi:hypothetical protein [Microbacterium sp. 4NA327F11]|uniref:hypothetical protein n=1 Tax=Microbacterium sp. 4NA327F11 TaxID=2502229 RepID=UPI0010F553BD|nr:hypothetical protein [Microbacterium sp. 4NA327F11]